MNLLDMVPSFYRQIRQYQKSTDTDSDLAAYLADGVEALAVRWDRSYVVQYIAPKTYLVEPSIALPDKRPVILMAAIIYKMATLQQAYIRDGDFAYDPRMVNAQGNPILMEFEELQKYVPASRLAKPITSSLRGFGNVYNPESYNWGNLGAILAQYG